MANRKLVLYIAMSVDGYIAGPGESLDFLSMVERVGEDYGYSAFTATIDTVILGRRTYDKVLSMGHEYPGSVQQLFVITRGERPSEGRVTFYNSDPASLVNKLKSMEGKDIYCDGGAEIVHLLMKDNLVDELTISVIPTLLGGGISLFKPGFAKTNLELLSCKAFETGLVQLHYKRK